MSDIVERLCEQNRKLELGNNICLEAAAEIIRLRAEKERLKAYQSFQESFYVGPRMYQQEKYGK